MKKFFICLAYTLIAQVIAAQAIQNEVIGSAGDVNLIGSTIVSWTVGEFATQSHCNTACLVTQGFHQTYFKILSILESHFKSLNVRVYPNPTTSLLNLNLSALSPGRAYRAILSNAEGKVLLQQEIHSDDTFQLHLHQFQDGLMILKVIDLSDSSQSSFKIIKINH